MNKAQKKALKKYTSNKLFVEGVNNIPPVMLVHIAQEQDRLYKVIHARQDSKVFSN